LFDQQRRQLWWREQLLDFEQWRILRRFRPATDKRSGYLHWKG
jgi:hypothetical protein